MNAGQYDKQVDWNKRLANEWPFYERLFRMWGISSLLDCACGTGRHAVLFALNGLRVAGVDIDPAMIAVAREHAASAGVEARFEVAALADLTRTFPSELFDAVICVGNSLSQLPDLSAVEEAVRNMAAVCRDGGLLVLHVLNYRAMLGRDVISRPLRVTGEDGNREIHQKIFLPGHPRVKALIVRLIEEGGAWRSEVCMGKLLPVQPADMLRIVANAGFMRAECMGDYTGAQFREDVSQDLILTAARAPGRPEPSGG